MQRGRYPFLSRNAMMIGCVACVFASASANRLLAQNFETRVWDFNNNIRVQELALPSGDTGHILRARYPPSDKGTERITKKFDLTSDVTSATMSYDMKLHSEWEFVKSGKLHGLGGGTTTTGCGDPDPKGWSVRLTWQDEINIVGVELSGATDIVGFISIQGWSSADTFNNDPTLAQSLKADLATTAGVSEDRVVITGAMLAPHASSPTVKVAFALSIPDQDVGTAALKTDAVFVALANPALAAFVEHAEETLDSGSPKLYIYHQDREGRCGDHFYSQNWQFERGVWYRIDVQVQMNSAPQNSDGVARLYIDGNLLVEATGLRLTGHASVDIDTFIFSTFYGGSNPTYSPSTTTFAYFDNFAVHTGLVVTGQEAKECELFGRGIYHPATQHCCPDSCGECGGSGCGTRPGGAQCCTNANARQYITQQLDSEFVVGRQ
jgi:hypothetical protein